VGKPTSVDQARITPYEDGPYLIRGPFELIDQEGNRIEVSRRTIALCRCGRSKIKPFCDGMHKSTKFKASSGRDAGPATCAGAGDSK
jgi:CDGSH-type Zn-finger protein